MIPLDVIVAERAAEALSLVGESRRKIDIVLTEFNLPDMDGLVFIERVLEIRTLPVFVARPKSIHKLMNIPELTISQVANHLQRYRAQMMGKAPQTMSIGRAEITSHFNMTPDIQRYEDQMQWRAAQMMPLRMAGNSEPDFRVVPHFLPRLTPEGPTGIYNEMALRLKMLEEMNRQNALPNLNLALNAAAVGNERLSLAPDGVRSFNFMNASNEY